MIPTAGLPSSTPVTQTLVKLLVKRQALWLTRDVRAGENHQDFLIYENHFNGIPFIGEKKKFQTWPKKNSR